MSSVGLGEFAFEDGCYGVDAVVPERGEAGETELVEHAGGDVVGRVAAVTAEQQVERGAHPADAEAMAVEHQVPVAGEPLQGDEVESLAANLRQALPNACLFGFTGTPIDKKDRSTLQTFGSYIDTYTIEQAVADGATVPIFYEGRLA